MIHTSQWQRSHVDKRNVSDYVSNLHKYMHTCISASPSHTHAHTVAQEQSKTSSKQLEEQLASMKQSLVTETEKANVLAAEKVITRGCASHLRFVCASLCVCSVCIYADCHSEGQHAWRAECDHMFMYACGSSVSTCVCTSDGMDMCTQTCLKCTRLSKG